MLWSNSGPLTRYTGTLSPRPPSTLTKIGNIYMLFVTTFFSKNSGQRKLTSLFGRLISPLILLSSNDKRILAIIIFFLDKISVTPSILICACAIYHFFTQRLNALAQCYLQRASTMLLTMYNALARCHQHAVTLLQMALGHPDTIEFKATCYFSYPRIHSLEITDDSVCVQWFLTPKTGDVYKTTYKSDWTHINQEASKKLTIKLIKLMYVANR